LETNTSKNPLRNYDEIVVALSGNPNSGKTTLFNALTGMRQKVANFSGVTVEKKEGNWSTNLRNVKLIDLPGLYSLDANSIDERIASDILTGKSKEVRKPDVIIAVADSTNLERNLYLVTQLIESRIPIVVVLTMADLAVKQDLLIDEAKLSELLQLPVVSVNAAKKVGRGFCVSRL
jgi:ferrous iron transport protein B